MLPSGAEPRFKICGGKNFEVILFLKVEEVERGKGYDHAPFRGGAQIQILWGTKFFEVVWCNDSRT